jgi:hypothetical protein
MNNCQSLVCRYKHLKDLNLFYIVFLKLFIKTILRRNSFQQQFYVVNSIVLLHLYLPMAEHMMIMMIKHKSNSFVISPFN